MQLIPGDLISDSIAMTGVHEPAFTKHLLKRAKAGGVLIDVGANLGYFTLLWLAANPENRCIAFEASPRNIEILRRNVNQNGFENRVQIIACGAGQAAGRMHFDLGPVDQTGWGGFSRESTGVEVDVVRVDEIVAADEPVALLKVDIEGADAWALMGCEKLLKMKIINEIWFEQNKPRMNALGLDENAAQEYLRSVGYSATAMSDASAELVDWIAVPDA